MWYLFLTLALASENCHPQCSWKCDTPSCPSVCAPVCETPSCHTSCTPPLPPVCDVRCAEPRCIVKCPDEPCISDNCGNCYTVCEEPECVTRCKAAEPKCEVMCDELKCGWKCHKPDCPKPRCELVCDNPHCTPNFECCKCASDGLPVTSEIHRLFKEDEPDANCCSCGDHQALVSRS